MKPKKLAIFTTIKFYLRKRWFIYRYASRYLYRQLAEEFFAQLWQTDYMSKSLGVAQLPITLVLGEAGSGKSALLAASKKLLPGSHYFKSNFQPIVGRSMPIYSLAMDQVYLELPQYFLVNESGNQIPYLEQLLQFWRATHIDKRIKHIFFTVSLSSLLDHSVEKQKKQEEFWSALTLLLARLSSVIEVSLIVTEVDRLQGFTEFFSDLSIEERQHVFGFSLSPQTHLLDQMQQQFFALSQRLQQRMWWRCRGEHLSHKRLLVAEFPKQFQAFCDPLMHYFSPLQSIMKNNALLQVKNCVFISAMQQGDCFDLLFTPENYFALKLTPHRLPMLPQSKEYFVRGFFKQMGASVASSSHSSLPDEKSSRWKKIVIPAVVFAVAITLSAAALLGWGFFHLHHVLNDQPELAYKILASDFFEQNLKEFVAYEDPLLPAPLQNVVRKSSALNQWIVSSTKKYLNQHWQAEVYAYYSKNIAGKYPIDRKGATEVSLAQFDAMYSKTGCLIKFRQNYLRNHSIQKLFINDPVLINLYTQLILAHRFLYPGSALQLSFNLYPNNFSSAIKTVNLMVAGKKITLKRKALISATINWPNNEMNHESGYAIQYDQKLPELQVFSGVWSWLKLFNVFRWQNSNPESQLNGGVYHYEVSNKEKEFSLKIDSNVPLNQLSNIFNQLSVPENI
jgi:type VI protein secretion system component VasK